MTVMNLRWSGHFHAAHILPGRGKCGYLHGHTYKVNVVLMLREAKGHVVVDYNDISRIVNELDHACLLPPNVEIHGVPYKHIVIEPEPSCEGIALYLLNKFLKLDGVVGAMVEVDEGGSGSVEVGSFGVIRDASSKEE